MYNLPVAPSNLNNATASRPDPTAATATSLPATPPTDGAVRKPRVKDMALSGIKT